MTRKKDTPTVARPMSRIQQRARLELAAQLIAQSRRAEALAIRNSWRTRV
jgi:hypothetical protein